MIDYKHIKNHVTARQAAEFYGLRVNHRGMAVCPFHPDKNPSLKLDERFYCFGCGEKGDAIDFTARYLNLTPSAAARRLAQDFHIHGAVRDPGTDKNQPLTTEDGYPPHLPPETPAQQENRRERMTRVFRTLADARGLLMGEKQRVEAVWELGMKPDWASERYAAVLAHLERVEYLMDLLLEAKWETYLKVLDDIKEESAYYEGFVQSIRDFEEADAGEYEDGEYEDDEDDEEC